jgi:hypothetical protein
MSVLHERLPRELRDQIYELVLTRPTGLRCCIGDDGLSSICAISDDGLRQATLPSSVHDLCPALSPGTPRTPRIKSFNQIQYVNRIFYEETVGLEFKYNDIVFEDGGGRSAARRCQIFVNEVLGRDYAQYLRLCFASSPSSVPRTTDRHSLTLREFCTYHPKATIRSYDRNWSLRYSNFITLGVAYADTFRGDPDMLEYLMRDLDTRTKLVLRERKNGNATDLPHNYRLFPCELQPNQATLCESIRQSSIVQSTDMSRWVALAEKWFKEGV